MRIELRISKQLESGVIFKSILQHKKAIHFLRILFGLQNIEVCSIDKLLLAVDVRSPFENIFVVVIVVDLEDLITPPVEHGKFILRIIPDVEDAQVIVKAIVVR